MFKKYFNYLKDKSYHNNLIKESLNIKDKVIFNKKSKYIYYNDNKNDLDNYFNLKKAMEEEFNNKIKNKKINE